VYDLSIHDPAAGEPPGSLESDFPGQIYPDIGLNKGVKQVCVIIK